MKINYTISNFLSIIFIFTSTISYSQVILYSNDFEGTDEDTYELFDGSDNPINFGSFNASDYILRTNPGSLTTVDVQPTGFGGSNVIIWEDFDGVLPGMELRIVTNSIDITDASDISIGLKVGVTNDAIARYEDFNYIRIEYELDNSGVWTTVGDFRGVKSNAVPYNFYEDDDLNGTYDLQITNVMRTVSYNLNTRSGSTITGTSLKVRVRANSGTQEEMVIDDLTVDAVAILGVEENKLRAAVTTYPNPSNGEITIKKTEGTLLENATIVDLNGRMVKSFDLSSNTDGKLSTQGISSGLYILNIKGERATISEKIAIN